MIVKSFITKKGKKAVIRYPERDDAAAMTKYINVLSKEDTYIRFSGEVVRAKEEVKYLTEVLTGIKKGDSVLLQCWIGSRLVGICNIDRNRESRKRELHTGIFGISVNHDVRGEGLGHVLAKTTIEEAKNKIHDLKIIILTVYEPNLVAYNLYKKLGFIDAGIIPEACLYRNQYIGKRTMYLTL